MYQNHAICKKLYCVAWYYEFVVLFPRLKFRGPIEVTSRQTNTRNRKKFPRLKFRGPIEVGRTDDAISIKAAFPRLKFRGPIEVPPTPKRFCFAFLISAA